VHSDRRVEDDATAVAPDAEREIVVLIALQPHVEETDLVEGFTPECAVREDVGVATNSARAAAHPPDPAERAVHRTGGGTLHDGPAFRRNEPADRQRTGLLGDDDALADVVAGVARMAIETYEERTLRLSDARVQRLRHPPRRVVENAEVETGTLGRREKTLDRPVVGTAVGDEDLHLAVEVLIREIGDEMLDVVGLVEHRGHHRDSCDRAHGSEGTECRTFPSPLPLPFAAQAAVAA
jgi:hypothetical protein